MVALAAQIAPIVRIIDDDFARVVVVSDHQDKMAAGRALTLPVGQVFVLDERNDRRALVNIIAEVLPRKAHPAGQRQSMRGGRGLDLVKPKRSVTCDAAGRVNIVRADILALREQKHRHASWPTVIVFPQRIRVVLRLVRDVQNAAAHFRLLSVWGVYRITPRWQVY